MVDEASGSNPAASAVVSSARRRAIKKRPVVHDDEVPVCRQQRIKDRGVIIDESILKPEFVGVSVGVGIIIDESIIKPEFRDAFHFLTQTTFDDGEVQPAPLSPGSTQDSPGYQRDPGK